MKIHKLILGLASLVFLSTFLTACNTAAGAGQDVQATGQAISNAF